ncbi:MAG: Rrf2 family transcriptional regulator [Elusimicrobia bacterium]|nr:Rrf2 family transcriptional regulator [Elusimicrobiota bacterium]
MSATFYLAQRPGQYCAVEEVAKKRGLPRSFLVKVLRHLARRGITRVQRGPGGGHILARHPNEISLAEIIEAVELPLAGARSCLLELHGCGISPCAIHEDVCVAERHVWKALRAVTLGSYAAGASGSGIGS